MTAPGAAQAYDVIVVGGGPAGAAMGWALAVHGVRVAILERAAFPRDKVCGDYIEPGGLRILARMGVLPVIESRERLRITRNRVYFGPKLLYQGPIHYYDHPEDELNYGLVISRREFDAILLQAAAAAGAHVFMPAAARTMTREGGMVSIEAAVGDQSLTLCAPLVVGADGTESMVAKTVGLRRTHRRHIGVAQRAYVSGVELDSGEAAVWFDEEIVPGYGWMFPMPGGLANVGVGFSSEASHRFGLPVREAFERALARLRLRHPGCARAELVSRPIGGVVKTYGGIDRNHFDGGLLIGDAGSFVDPLTGEGITHGMESAILALPTLLEALERGQFEADDLVRFDHDFRAYFDPAMRYLALSGALVSNRHLAEFWLRVGAHGHEEAAGNPAFARLAGSIFGGPALQPLAVSAQMWSRVFARYAQALADPGGRLSQRFAEDLQAFQRGWTRSATENPEWHEEWLRDVVARTLEVQKTIWTRRNPRPDGVFRFVDLEDPVAESRPIPIAATDTQAMLVQTVRAVVEAGLAVLTARGAPPEPPAAAPKRRWRVKP